MNFVLIIAQCATNFFIIFFFLTDLFEKRYRPLMVIAPIIIAFSVFLACINRLGLPAHEMAIVNSIASFSSASLMVAVLFKGKLKNLMFAGVVANAIIIGCEFMPPAIVSIYSESNIFTVTANTIRDVGFCFISTGIFFVIALIAKFSLIQYFTIKGKALEPLNIFLLPLPILSIVIVYYIFRTSEVATLSPNMVILSICIVLSLVIINIIVFASDSDSNKKHQYRSQIAEMYLQNELQEKLNQQQNNHIKETNALTHDYRHQLITLNSIISNMKSFKSVQNAATYISQTLESLASTDTYTEIKSEALRYILIHSDNECAHKGIAFNSQIMFSDFESFMTYQDICTIFCNSLENAIRACTQLREEDMDASINISVKRNNRLVSISICNNKCNEIIKKDGIIQTTEKSDSRHGYGLLNIERIAKRYNGSLEIEHTDSMFTLSILLATPQDNCVSDINTYTSAKV